MHCQRKLVLRGSPVTAVDRPPTAFKKSVADEWVVPWVLNASAWLEDVSGWQIGVLGSFAARRSLGRSDSRLEWQVYIPVCQCPDYRNVPSQRLTGLPRSHKSVRAPAVSSCQAAWLFRHWNTGCSQRPYYVVIESMMSDYPAWCLFTDQAMKAVSVYRRSATTSIRYTDAATKTQSDCHTDCVVRRSAARDGQC